MQNHNIQVFFLNTFCETEFTERTLPTTALASRVGNSYSSSIFFNIVSLLARKDAKSLVGSKCALYAYGSGSCASLYTLSVQSQTTETLEKLVSVCTSAVKRLDLRHKATPQSFVDTLELRHALHNISRGDEVELFGALNEMWDDAYCLLSIDGEGRREYGLVSEWKDKVDSVTQFPLVTDDEKQRGEEEVPTPREGSNENGVSGRDFAVFLAGGIVGILAAMRLRK